MASPKRKPLHFMASSLKDLREMPEPVQDVFVPHSSTHSTAIILTVHGPFGEGVPRAVMKLVEDFDRDTYRAAYTVSLPQAVYVLHVFKKKSATGVATPKPDKDAVRTRLKAAEEHHRRTYAKKE